MSQLQNDCINAWIEGLQGEGRKAFARQQWDFLNGRGNRPDHRQHGISDKAAETIVVSLAGKK